MSVAIAAVIFAVTIIVCGVGLNYWYEPANVRKRARKRIATREERARAKRRRVWS